ncbi:coiled-coil domain-containing protein 177 [Epinephelus fuscoguttatus]|uniref:coiled-coil domain-containing protein 177 n=1 Tax=Epinephelus fuscoguttatus TaxID=293821 RepID=UPI0020D18EE5|nr:coiled-coil domain-containing protein 177 [Epinephelus fuscoguttatus]XP_049452743.1 coiled-coil domain-containing protein 177 [Epinephelus fuscoguttatus]XP_049452744.1 coiled-coil domain-containing protein 177 [Epinephelus fuscoguttatus]
MVDPSEAEEQSKCKGPQVDTPAVATEDPRLPEQADGTTTEEDGDAGFETPPTGSSEPSPCHTATPGPDTASQGVPPEQPQTQTDTSPKLHLDLYNFDSPAAEGSRYVLTSPHSLEACARCGVKPVELLPRPLADFAREAPGRSMRVATGLFEVYERDRHAKLRQCREERERIVREEKRRILQATVNTSSSASASSVEQQHKASSGSAQPPKSGPVTSSSAPDFGASSRAAASGPTSKTGTSILSKAPTTSTSPKTAHAASTPSSRTGSTTSTPSPRGGFQGKHVLSSSSEQVKTTRPLSSGPPPVIRKSSGGKSSNTFPRSTPKPPAFPRANSTLTSSVTKPAVQSPGTPLNGITGTPFSQHNGHLGFHSKVRGKSHSLESLQRRMDPVCSSTSTTTTTTTCTSSESGASSSYSWDGPRDHWAKVSSPRARTMATFNSLMGRSLSLGDLSHSIQTTQKVERIVKEVKRRGLKAVSERDRKIAALMLARYQEEDIMSQTRYVAHLQWDSERRMEELRREQEEREKQRAMLQCQRVWQTQVSIRQRRLSQQERQSAAAKMRQAEESEERWRELAEQQERNRLLRLQQAAREEKHKKALQEQNLKALEEERAAILEQERLLLKEKLTMAELKRQEREHQAQEDRRGLNKAEKRRHAALIQEIARREQEEREEARRAAEEKLSRSLENYEQIVERRGQELKEKAKREEQQILKARKAAEKRERQQQQLLEARVKEAEKRAQQAAVVAEERAKEKAQRAVQSRLEKEKLQKLNRQRVEEEERQRRLELLQSIERKLEKSEQIFKEKRAVLESARSVARASFHVRDKVREETNMRTFDKMALEAQLKASLDEK